MTGAIRLGLLFALTLALSACSLVSIQHCTFYNLLPALGIAYDPPVCAGGQPTFRDTVKVTNDVQLGSGRRGNE